MARPFAIVLFVYLLSLAQQAQAQTASSTAPGSSPQGAVDGNRFSVSATSTWQGRAGAGSWWWQIQFPKPCKIGAILQINGDHPLCLRNSAKTYLWQGSLDGKTWRELPETAVTDERRVFRIHRLKQVREVRFLRLQVSTANGDFPTLREVEFFADPRAVISFEPWAVVVSTTGESKVPGAGATEFTRLARSCK